jgi:hypothetical protein
VSNFYVVDFVKTNSKEVEESQSKFIEARLRVMMLVLRISLCSISRLEVRCSKPELRNEHRKRKTNQRVVSKVRL